MRIALTGATGHLGHLVIESLLARGVAASDIVALVRTESKAADLAAQGVNIAVAPYEGEAALTAGLADVDRLVLVSSSEVGKRAEQHANVISAVKAAGVSLIAYTSLLRADSSTLSLADEHVATEKLLADSGIDHVLLRNGWYWENFESNLDTAKVTGHTFGAAGAGVVNGAARRDYAEAAAIAITSDDQAGKVYELAGQPGLDYAQIATVVGEVIGSPVTYVDQGEGEFVVTLQSAGLPEDLAQLFAGWDVSTADGALASSSTDLQDLIGRESASLGDVLSA